MTDTKTAKRIGYKQVFKAITVGLVVAYLIFASMAGPFWLFEFSYSSTLIFAALVLYGVGYLIGGQAGKLIIVKKYPAVVVGIASGFLIVWIGTFVGSLVGYFNDGLPDSYTTSHPFEDYIMKPMVMISVWGLIPIVGVGIWYGLSINRCGKRINSDQIEYSDYCRK